MSAIQTQLQNSGYYQLNSSGAGSGNTSNAARSAVAKPSLASALGNVTNSSSSYSDAVLVDLSPEAQKYLSGLGSPGATINSTPAANDSFVLSSQQKVALAAVLDTYKDAPYTQATFDQIQDDLQKAGLGPNQLSVHERVTSFSTTAALVDALNGGHGTTPGSTVISDGDLQKKATNYIQDIATQWKKISTDYQAKQGTNTVHTG